MDRDKLIAVILIVGVIFAFFAILGVVTVTGLALFFVLPDNSADGAAPAEAEIVPIIETVGSDDDSNSGIELASQPVSQNNAGKEPEQQEAELEVVEVKPEPVCGNNTKEEGEQCEADSHCSSNQACNTATCECENKAPEKALLSNLSVESLRFFCAPDYNGKKGLAINRITIKNKGASDYSYGERVKITSQAGDTEDSVLTTKIFDFSIEAGKTLDVFGSNFTRTQTPYLFLGTKLVPLKLTFELGENYFEYTYNLKASDFSSTNPSCL